VVEAKPVYSGAACRIFTAKEMLCGICMEYETVARQLRMKQIPHLGKGSRFDTVFHKRHIPIHQHYLISLNLLSLKL
jgi:hypothetical protein